MICTTKLLSRIRPKGRIFCGVDVFWNNLAFVARSVNRSAFQAPLEFFDIHFCYFR